MMSSVQLMTLHHLAQQIFDLNSDFADSSDYDVTN